MTQSTNPIADFSTLSKGQSCLEMLRMTVPIFVFILAELSLESIDIIMVGRLGENQLASLGLAASFFALLTMLCFGGINVVGGIFSHSLAQNNRPHIQDTINATTISCLAFAGLAMVPLVYPAGVFHVLHQPPELLADYNAYLSVRRWGLPLICLLSLYRNMLNAYNISTVVTLTGFAMPFLNILFNYALIYGNFGWPALGVQGAAYASNGVELTATLILVYALKTNEKSKSYAYFTNVLQMRWPILKHNLGVAIPMAVANLFEGAFWTFPTFVVGWIGSQAMTVHKSFLSILYIIITFPIALGVTVMIITGNLAGLRKGATIGTLPWLYTLVNGGYAVLLALAFWGGGSLLIPAIYPRLSPDTVIQMNQLLPLGVLLCFTYGVQFNTSCVLRGLNRTGDVMIISAIFYLALGSTTYYILAIAFNLQVIGVWLAMTFIPLVSGAVTVWWVKQLMQTPTKAYAKVHYVSSHTA